MLSDKEWLGFPYMLIKESYHDFLFFVTSDPCPRVSYRTSASITTSTLLSLYSTYTAAGVVTGELFSPWWSLPCVAESLSLFSYAPAAPPAARS